MKYTSKNGMAFVNGINSPGKKVYIVRGSEDGNLGVYSNFKRAYQEAVNYVTNDGEWNLELNKTYSQAVKDKYLVNIHEKGNWRGNSANIQMYWLNE